MVSVSELWQTWQEGFANKDSSTLAEFLTDDFEMVVPSGTRNRQQTLDWTAAGGSPTTIDNLEVLYENDEVAVTHHSPNNNASLAMALYTKRGDKFSQVSAVRQAL